MLIPGCIFVFDALLGSAWDKRRQFTMPGSIQEEKQNLVTQGRDYQAISVRGDPKITEFKGLWDSKPQKLFVRFKSSINLRIRFNDELKLKVNSKKNY